MAGAAIEPTVTAARRVANFICFTPYFEWLYSLPQNPRPFGEVPFYDGNEMNRGSAMVDGGSENRPCQRGFRPPLARSCATICSTATPQRPTAPTPST